MFEHFVGDGLIFATPQGSTGYNLSAGGSIVDENVEGFAVTPMNSHKTYQYYSLMGSVVVSSETEARVTVKEIEKRPYKVVVDGQTLSEWPEDEHQVTIRMARDKRLQIIRFQGHDYFKHLSAAFRGQARLE
jgi:NAD+ kinase